MNPLSTVLRTGETGLLSHAAGEPLISAYLLTVKSLDEFGEVVPSVMRAWCGLRMVLDTECWQVYVPNTFYCVIIEVTMRHLK